MGKIEKLKLFGLIGRDISYSFSQQYFSEKFDLLELDKYAYRNFDINTIDAIKHILTANKSSLSGLNVTIPFKEEVIPFLDKLHPKAKKIGAVNTIKITRKGKLKGYNTDEYGFRKSLIPLLKKHHKRALILGTGGASKAISFALDKLKITHIFVSRTPRKGQISYRDLNEDVFEKYTIIINCTPIGTYPNLDSCPNLPYQLIDEHHLLYDLIYNPKETLFLKRGADRGATTKNGLEMLELQAEKAWRIWNK